MSGDIVEGAYKESLNAIPNHVSIGVTTIRIYRPDELGAGQIGYSRKSTGQSISGVKDGDWRENWVVIGYDASNGDPLFIDIEQPNFPVYTAAAGQGRWDQEPVAKSLHSFRKALLVLLDLSKGRENPVLLERNPIPKSERGSFISEFERDNPGVGSQFWESILDFS